jgi:hypothetical protein
LLDYGRIARYEVDEFAESSCATTPDPDLCRRRCGPFLVRLGAACSSALDANGRAGALNADATSRKGPALLTVGSCTANPGAYLTFYDYTLPRKHSAVPIIGTMLAADGATKFVRHRTIAQGCYGQEIPLGIATPFGPLTLDMQCSRQRRFPFWRSAIAGRYGLTQLSSSA